MRLHEVRLTNFRQFRGAQSFDLSPEPLKPVALIFGTNGSGKTTLLNAFTWALYGSLSEDVEHQERMVTDSVWRSLPIGDSVEVSVELFFDHEGQKHHVLRRAQPRKESDEQRPVSTEVQLWTTKPDGSSEMAHAPQEVINKMLPRGVSRFFFFNGERIENLVKKGSYAEVQQDIKVLLDLEQVERALLHLPKLERKLSTDLKRHGDANAQAIQTALDSLRDDDEKLREQLKLLEGDLASLSEEQELVTDALRQHAAVAPIQQQRDGVVRDLADARGALDAALKERNALVATRGFLAFTEALSEKSSAMAESLYQRGTLPAPLKREFVDQLLDEGACICGTPLAEHSDAWTHVSEWRQRAGLQEVEAAWQQLRAQIAPIDANRKELRESLGQVLSRVSLERERISRLQETKSELDGKLQNSRLEGVPELEAKRQDLERRHGEKLQRLGVVKESIAQTAREIVQKTNERSTAVVKDELAQKARARAELVERVHRVLEEILQIRQERMRRHLDAELKEVFRSISRKDYVPNLNEAFELTLTTEVDGVTLPVPKSTGENQILSLSFVAAVSKLARETRQASAIEAGGGDDAGIYPIVMDAAFGSLDHDYQESVSRVLAKMAPQLVVLVSKTQGLGKVLTELGPYVSHLGIVEMHTSLVSKDEEDIELDGTEYPFIRHAASDFSRLKEIG